MEFVCKQKLPGVLEETHKPCTLDGKGNSFLITDIGTAVTAWFDLGKTGRELTKQSDIFVIDVFDSAGFDSTFLFHGKIKMKLEFNSFIINRTTSWSFGRSGTLAWTTL